MANLEKEVEQWLNIALINEKIHNLKLLECKSSENVDGFSGNMKFVKAVAEKNGKTEEYNLVVKYSSRDISKGNYALISDAYKREIYIYDTVLKSFRSFEDSHGILDRFEAYPKFYKGIIFDNFEVIVFNNLKSLGFQLNTNLVMNWEERTAIAREYAKFHAISFAMRQKNPDGFRKLSANLPNLIGKFFENPGELQNGMIKQFKKSMMILQKHNEHKLIKYYESKCTLEEFRKMACQKYEDDEKYSVITHADNWNNNFMFKYNNDNKLDKCVILDYQISEVSTPMRDILNFFYFNTDPELFDSEVHKFFDFYYTELGKNLKNYGCDIETIYPKNILLQHWKKYSKVAFVLAQMSFIVRYANKADLKAEGTFEDMVNLKFNDNNALEKNLICLYRHFAENSLV